MGSLLRILLSANIYSLLPHTSLSACNFSDSQGFDKNSVTLRIKPKSAYGNVGIYYIIMWVG
jgi:hypothetical protein